MWLLMAILTLLLWGIADLFYKKGNDEKEKYSHLKTGMIVGFVMGLHAIIYMIVKGISLDFIAMLKYLPVSLCYIVSMIIGYKGLKYIIGNIIAVKPIFFNTIFLFSLFSIYDSIHTPSAIIDQQII